MIYTTYPQVINILTGKQKRSLMNFFKKQDGGRFPFLPPDVYFGLV